MQHSLLLLGQFMQLLLWHRKLRDKQALLSICCSAYLQVASLMAEVAEQLVLITTTTNNNSMMHHDPNPAHALKEPCSPAAAQAADSATHIPPPSPTYNTPYSSSSSTPSAPCDRSTLEAQATLKQSPARKKTNAEIDAERAAMLESCRTYTTPEWYEKTKALLCPEAFLNGDIRQYYADIAAEEERLMRGFLTAPATTGLQSAGCSVDAMQVDGQPCYSWDSEDSEYEYEVVVDDSDDDGEGADGGGFD